MSPDTTASGGVDADRTSRRALLVALGVDNLGSGLFLPLSVVYLTGVVGIPLALAGLLVTVGTLVGLAAPPLAGALVDRRGPKVVVVASQVLQAAGMLVYLLATGPVTVLLAAALVAAGTQTFYPALFALIADVAPAGPTDHTFARVEMVRSAAFGVGALLAAALVWRDVGVLRVALLADAVSFVTAAVLLLTGVRARLHRASTHHVDRPAAPVDAAPADAALTGPRSVLTDRPYLALIVVAALLALPSDFLLVGLAPYLHQLDPRSVWAAGAGVAVVTAALALFSGSVVRASIRWPRTTAIAVGGWCSAAWAALSVAAVWLPERWVGPWVLGCVVLLAADRLVGGTRANALAEAAAPPASRGRHLAAFQYAFTTAGLLALLLVSSLAVAPWLPWVLIGASALLGAIVVPWVGRHLPADAVRPATPARSSP